MQKHKTLNLRPEEVEKFSGILNEFEQLEFKEEFIVKRCTAHSCTITLYKSGKLLIQGEASEAVANLLMGHFGEEQVAIGIDETGRGENFGPLVVAGVLGDRNKFRHIRDSKKTKDVASLASDVKRDAVKISTVVVGSKAIDELRGVGIKMDEIQCRAMRRIIDDLREKMDVQALIDGLPMRVQRPNIHFIVKGDDKDPLISAASVVAKATRDASSDHAKRQSWKSKKP